jgi:DNA-binding transcriptional regulator YiaG
MNNEWTPERIRGLRQSLGLSLQRFAALFPMNYHSVMYWEHGKVKPNRMSITRLEQIDNGKVKEEKL